MDKLLLAVLVTFTGSLLLPAMRLVPVNIPRRVWKAVSSETPSEVKKQIDDAPRVQTKGLEFRPLTVEEKKELENSMDGKRNPRASKRLAHFPSPASTP